MDPCLPHAVLALCTAALLPPVVAQQPATAAAVSVDMQTMPLRLDGRGRMAALLDRASGRDLAQPGRAFCRLDTAAGFLDPEAASQAAGRVTFAFPGGAVLAYTVTPANGFAVWDLAEVRGTDLAALESVRLAELNLTGLPTFRSQPNAVSGDDATVAVMATRINVCASGTAEASRGASRDGVTHTFTAAPADRPGATGWHASPPPPPDPPATAGPCAAGPAGLPRVSPACHAEGVARAWDRTGRLPSEVVFRRGREAETPSMEVRQP